MRVLFVCTGNVFRSMAVEYCLRNYLRENKISGIDVASAGTNVDDRPIHPLVLSALAGLGIDASKHVAKSLIKELIELYNTLIAMGEDHKKFIKEKFGVEAPLFNEVCFGEMTPVLDVWEAVPDWKVNKEAMRKHVKETITHIHKSIPFLAERLLKS